jgi:hypothetical protein
MNPISSAIPVGFTWSKLPRYESYEVRLNGDITGALHRSSIWSSNYEAITADASYTFRRNGWWGTRAEIIDSASRQQIALFESRWGERGVLTFANGEKVHMDRKGCWRPTWNVTGGNGQSVLSLRAREKTCEINASSGFSSSRLSLLMMFTLYRIRQAEEDSSAAVSAALAAI